jgi:pimeloyl-ACP methyl ester carboxylesterase
MLDRIAIDGVDLEYELRGTGEPVVLIHWGVGAVWAGPLLDQPALADRYRLLSYHRAGFAGSSRLNGSVTMATHAAHCHLLMRELGMARAHIVGHSSSGPVALQLAPDAPEAVHTLALMETARPAPPTDTQQRFGTDVAQPAAQRYRAGDPAGAVDTFFRGVLGPGYRPALDRGMPGAFDQAVADAGAFFTQEMPALWQWPFTEDDALRIQQPVLAVLGTASPPMFAERQKLLLQWLPNAEPLDLPGLTHLLHGQDPTAVADGLAGFFARHPIHGEP